MNTPVTEAFKQFERFANFERSPSDIEGYRLDRIGAMLDLFDNPQNEVNIIHIAGSKGKGSTAHIAAGILAASGYAVGLYASPHLIDYRERICRPEGFFSDAAYIDVLGRVYEWAQNAAGDTAWKHGAPTTFEMLTLAAFLMFRREKIEWAVVETGLGGRLDATNAVARPAACLISAIELEHTEILGNTLREIAGEKAGIFKSGAITIVQEQASEILDVFRTKARSLGSEMEIAGTGRWDSSSAGTGTITVSLSRQSENPGERRGEGESNDPSEKNASTIEIQSETMLWGHYQAMNASLASLAVLRLWQRGRLDRIKNDASLREAVAAGIKNAAPPGRLERYSFAQKKADLVLDVSHTPNSVREALDCVENLADGRPLYLLFGSVLGKRHEEMASILAPRFSRIWVTTPGTFKASDPAQVHKAFSLYATGPCDLKPDSDKAIEDALDTARNDNALLLVCGSFYLAGLVVPALDQKKYGKMTCR